MIRVSLESLGTDIVCNIAGSMIVNVILVVEPKKLIIYPRSGIVAAKMPKWKKEILFILGVSKKR